MLTLLMGLAFAAPPDLPPSGAVEAYVHAALVNHPEILADRAVWQASIDAVPSQRALPEPRASVGAFVQSVETRVGPQQVRLGLQQAIPWPSRLVQAGKAAWSDAEAAEHLVDVSERQVRERVELAYWSLWQVREERARRVEHRIILDGLAETVRSRVEVGQVSLAELQQVELSRSRLDDALATLDVEETVRIAKGDRMGTDWLGRSADIMRSSSASGTPRRRSRSSAAAKAARAADSAAGEASPNRSICL